MASDFVHLHVHSHYSISESTIKIPQLVRAAKGAEMDAVALTDSSNLFAAIEFQSQAKKAGVKPIYGTQLKVISDNEDGRLQRLNHLVLLAENLEGYYNLVELVSAAGLADRDRQEHWITTWQELEQHSAGLIALTGDIGGEVPQSLLRGDPDQARAVLDRLVGIYGDGNVYLEIQRHEDIPETLEACEALVRLSRETGLPLVATNNVHFIKPEDFKAQALLVCIGLKKRITTELLEKVPLRDLYFRSKEEMADLFADLPEAIANTRKIADRCDVVIPTGKNLLPEFDVPDGEPVNDYLRRICAAQLEERFEEIALSGRPEINRDEYFERLETELSIIISMGFAGYFLIVADFIAFARSADIPVGPGRGSGAGSLVAYVLRITDIDPLQYGLLFERFLNPERVSMPDFDVDFCRRRRGEVISYVVEKYGKERVGQIVTYSQLKARAVIKTVARALGYEVSVGSRLASLVPAEVDITLDQALSREPKLVEAFSSTPEMSLLRELCLALEGNISNTGVHAGGVVIAGNELWKLVPVFQGSAEIVTQFAKDEVEKAGLVKFDLLGLQTLTVISDAVNAINEGRPKDDQFDLTTVRHDDPRVYELLSRGATIGVFQMESEGFVRLMRRMKPDRMEDLIAGVAIYRPGPLGAKMDGAYIDVKHGRKRAHYLHPALEDILAETYGTFLYQEQIMGATRALAGYSLGGADLFRRAIGAKNAALVEEQRAPFVGGAVENGVDEAIANEIFDQIRHFAGYGFNKSHSAAYARLAYHTAYLKVHYPGEFYAALMTNDAGDSKKVVPFIRDARAHDITILPPDINDSILSFRAIGRTIRFGLGGIKHVGESAVEAIIKAREERRFSDFDDFFARIDHRAVTKQVVEKLVDCGAFDSLHPDYREHEEVPLSVLGARRAQLAEDAPAAFARGATAKQDRERGQSSLMALLSEEDSAPMQVTLPDTEPWTERELLSKERDGLGIYVSGHPMDRFDKTLKQMGLSTIDDLNSKDNWERVRLGVMLQEVTIRQPRSGGGKFAIGLLEDQGGQIRFRVSPKNLEELEEALLSRDPVAVEGQLRRDVSDEGLEELSLTIYNVSSLGSLVEAETRRVVLQLNGEAVTDEQLRQLHSELSAYPGRATLSVKLVFKQGLVELVLDPELRVTASDEFYYMVRRLFPRAHLDYTHLDYS